MTETVAPAPAKVDPESLAIRSRPPRAIRFKRRAIIAIAAAGSISLAAMAWMALKPRMVRPDGARQELAQPDTLQPQDALKEAPATYADVPRLGPPLPGDLGKPILERQQQLAGATPRPDQAEQPAIADRRLADVTAARESGLLVEKSQGATVPAVAPAFHAPILAGGEAPGLDPDRDPNAQMHKAAFVGRVDSSGDVNPHALQPPASPYTLSAGSVLSASLITGLNSDLPGLVIAQVTENAYDSATGRFLLVPQGSRLIGSYDSVVAFGQKRALIVWQRIILPNGASLRIDNVPATDSAGYAGITDRVDPHAWQLLKGAALSTLLGVGSELALSGQSDLVEAIRVSTQDSASREGDQLTQRAVRIQPTIAIRPGAPVRLLVHHDLILEPWKEAY